MLDDKEKIDILIESIGRKKTVKNENEKKDRTHTQYTHIR